MECAAHNASSGGGGSCIHEREMAPIWEGMMTSGGDGLELHTAAVGRLPCQNVAFYHVDAPQTHPHLWLIGKSFHKAVKFGIHDSHSTICMQMIIFFPAV